MLTTIFLLLFASTSVPKLDGPLARPEDRTIILPPKPAPEQTLLEITDDTVVILDGKKTTIDKIIPEQAEIVKLDLAKDGITVLRVEYKTKGKK